MRMELLLLARDRAVALAALFLSLLCVLALANGQRWRERQVQAQARALAAERAAHDAQRAQLAENLRHPPPPLDSVLLNLHDPASPYVVGQAGRTVQVTLPALAATTIGLFDYLPLQELVSIRTRQRTVSDKDGLENPLQLAAGRFDLAFVVIFLIPLFLLALTYNLLSLEREQGTLALLRSQPIFLGWRFLLKVFLRSGLLIAICCLTAAIAAGSEEPGPTAFWIATVIGYGAFWAALTLWVNSCGYNSATNATILTVCWVLAVAIIPAILQMEVNTVRPAPSRLELLAVVREQSIDQRRDGKPLAKAFYSEHPELLPAGHREAPYDTAIAGTMTHIEQDRRTLPLEAKFDDSLARRQEWVSTFRFLSPAILVSEALQDCAGTGLTRHRHYKEQVRAFRSQWLAWFHPRIFRKMTLQPAEFDMMPRFVYRPETAAAWMQPAVRAIAGLGVFATVLVLLALRRLR